MLLVISILLSGFGFTSKTTLYAKKSNWHDNVACLKPLAPKLLGYPVYTILQAIPIQLIGTIFSHNI